MSTSDSSAAPSAEAIVVGAVSRLRQSGDPAFHRLKRGTRLLDAMLEPVFGQTVQRLRAHGCFSPEANIACALLLQPFVSGESKVSLGSALANAKRQFSPLRFGQLIAADSPDELFMQMQRALRFIDGRASAFDVARMALGWTDSGADRMRKRLIAHFHALPDTEGAAA